MNLRRRPAARSEQSSLSAYRNDSEHAGALTTLARALDDLALEALGLLD